MNWNGKTVLVTGGAGLIGSRVVKILVQKGAKVKILDDCFAYPFNQLKHFEIEELENITFIKGNIKDKKTVQNACKNVDIIFHEAAFADVAACVWNPLEDFNTNLEGTFNLLTAARDNEVDKFIFASSAAVYGDQPWRRRGTPPIFTETLKPNPLSTYANSKLWGEFECLLFYRLYGLKTTVLRYFSVYGEPQVPKKGSHSWVIAIFMMRAIKKKPLIIFGDGNQVRDFIHVEDVAKATVLADEKETTTGQIINIGTGVPTSIKKLANLIMKITGEKIAFQFKPRPKGDPIGGYADVSLMKKCLGWEPNITLEIGLQRYYRWLLKNKHCIPDWV